MYLPWSGRSAAIQGRTSFPEASREISKHPPAIGSPLCASTAESSKGPHIWAFSMLLTHLPGCQDILTAVSQYSFYLCQVLPQLFFVFHSG